jgi:hypothetical protein
MYIYIYTHKTPTCFRAILSLPGDGHVILIDDAEDLPGASESLTGHSTDLPAPSLTDLADIVCAYRFVKCAQHFVLPVSTHACVCEMLSVAYQEWGLVARHCL